MYVQLSLRVHSISTVKINTPVSICLHRVANKVGGNIVTPYALWDDGAQGDCVEWKAI